MLGDFSFLPEEVEMVSMSYRRVVAWSLVGGVLVALTLFSTFEMLKARRQVESFVNPSGPVAFLKGETIFSAVEHEGRKFLVAEFAEWKGVEPYCETFILQSDGRFLYGERFTCPKFTGK